MSELTSQSVRPTAADLGQGLIVDQHVVHRRRFAVRGNAEVGGGVGLGVQSSTQTRCPARARAAAR